MHGSGAYKKRINVLTNTALICRRCGGDTGSSGLSKPTPPPPPDAVRPRRSRGAPATPPPPDLSRHAVSINVRCSNGSKFSVRASVGSTVSQFKQVIAENCDVPAVQQRLIYKGRILKDDQTLDSYGLIGFCSWVSSCETRPWLR